MKRLPLNDCPETVLYRAICKRLKSDPDLNRVVKTWTVFDGTPGEVTEKGELKTPYLTVLPVADQASIETERTTTSPMTVAITCGTDGTDVTDTLNLWSAIRKCLFPGDGSMQAILQANNGYMMKIGKPGFGRVPVPGGAYMMVAEGNVKIEMLVPTAL